MQLTEWANKVPNLHLLLLKCSVIRVIQLMYEALNLKEMNHWIDLTFKHVWNVAMHVLHIGGGLS